MKEFKGIRFDTPDGIMAIWQQNVEKCGEGVFVSIDKGQPFFISKVDFESFISWANELSWE